METGLPSPPFYHVPNLNNLRDAALACGGLKTLDGERVRPGVLFRSAEVSKVDGEGWSRIVELGVSLAWLGLSCRRRLFFWEWSKQEVDRGLAGITNEEGKDAEDVVQGWEATLKSAGVVRSWVPVFREADYSPEKLAERYMKYLGKSTEGFVSAYHDILSDGGPAFRTILLYLANLPPPDAEPQEKCLGALIHCTAGKDRTGIFFGLLFSFLGVPDAQIADEYQLTEPGLSHIYDAVLPRLVASPAFVRYQREKLQGGSEEEGRKAALRMLGAKRESMLGALEMLRGQWGSSEKYMREVCGLGDGEVEALRRNLLVHG
ncbi:tyrosine phosphatase [Paraphaeosphaeria minitans]|uniref:Tyrosine phosphatase n=1 Tax=Paraphaeosphaeria minitans TaxID=565426 RepID=A0A9P6GCZ9_9PLEO|nr:tyrosine phosphatase [Paraphaeosphaeria minitans]